MTLDRVEHIVTAEGPSSFSGNDSLHSVLRSSGATCFVSFFSQPGEDDDVLGGRRTRVTLRRCAAAVPLGEVTAEVAPLERVKPTVARRVTRGRFGFEFTGHANGKDGEGRSCYSPKISRALAE